MRDVIALVMLAASAGLMAEPEAPVQAPVPDLACVVEPSVEIERKIRDESLDRGLLAVERAVDLLTKAIEAAHPQGSAAPLPPADAAEPGGPPVISGVAWHTSLDKAEAESKATGKPVLAFVHQENCRPCQLIEKIQEDPEVAKYIHENFVPFSLDLTIVGNKYRVRTTPTYVVMKGKRELRFEYGSMPRTPTAHIELLKYMAGEFKR